VGLSGHIFAVPRFPSKSGLIHKHTVKTYRSGIIYYRYAIVPSTGTYSTARGTGTGRVMVGNVWMHLQCCSFVFGFRDLLCFVIMVTRSRGMCRWHVGSSNTLSEKHIYCKKGGVTTVTYTLAPRVSPRVDVCRGSTEQHHPVTTASTTRARARAHIHTHTHARRTKTSPRQTEQNAGMKREEGTPPPPAPASRYVRG
jgi:hypothetical protein